jgi:hypothetical protein
LHRGRWGRDQTPDEITQNLAERWCWQVARRDDARIARRLYRKPLGDGVYRLDEGALLDDFCPFRHAIEVMAVLEQVDGTAIQRERRPGSQSLVRSGLKTLCGIDRLKALPPWLFSDEAVMPLGGFTAPQGRQGICQRGATTRQGERPPGPICPDTLAKPLVTLNLRAVAAVFNGSSRALATAGVLGATVTGMAAGTDLETTERYPGGGQVTRQVRLEEKRGRVHAIEVTVYGWNVLRRIDAVTTMPLAVTVVQMQEHAILSGRALVTQARTNLAGHARRHQVVCARGVWEGTALWWLDQQGLLLVVPAKATLAVPAEAQAHAAAGADVTGGRRVHSGRHGPGQTAPPERLETEVVGSTGLTTDDPYGPAAHGRDHNRRDFQANPLNAVVVRHWDGRDDGPGGNTVFLTNAPVDTPVRPFDDDDDRRLIEHCGLKATTQPWALGPPPQKQDRAVRVPVICTWLICALATAYRLQGEHEARGGAPVGWQRWRRQLLEQTRDRVMVCAAGSSGLLHLAEYSR